MTKKQSRDLTGEMVMWGAIIIVLAVTIWVFAKAIAGPGLWAVPNTFIWVVTVVIGGCSAEIAFTRDAKKQSDP